MTLKIRLAIMNFLQFAVWGSYLTCMGIYLSRVGMGSHIGAFYAMQGIVSIFMPPVMGFIADRWIPAQRLFGYCHIVAGFFMLMLGWYGYIYGHQVEFSILYGLFSMSIAFYMPTLSLSYSTAYSAMHQAGMDTVKEFPAIRMFGTVGFIATMWFVDLLDYEQSYYQFIVSGVLSLLLFFYSFLLPSCPIVKLKKKSFSSIFGLEAFTLFRQRKMAIFFIFSIFIGVCLHITNAFATPYISHFQNIPEYAESFGVKYPVLLYSISQVSETFCILLIPFFMPRYGIKNVMLIAIFAWVLRFAFLGAGNPGNGIWLFILSMIIYGVAFDFFNISGSLFVNNSAPAELCSSAQGLFILMNNGLGATIGSLAAQTLVNNYTTADGHIEWTTCWYLFAAYALVVAIAFALIFRPKKKDLKV